MDKCNYYHEDYNRPECWGTKEREICSCCGDQTKCNFYPEKRTTAQTRKPIDRITVGIEVKNCKDCEYRHNDIRDNLLVTAGTRAAYMDMKGIIHIPGGVDHEAELSVFISKVVDRYLTLTDINFDLFIEAELYSKYGVKNN